MEAQMAARLLEGKPIAAEIRAEVAHHVRRLREQAITPCLAVLLVGDDPASAVYVRNKERACAEVGITSRLVRLSGDASEDLVLRQVASWNEDDTIHGILVQLPLPPQMAEQRVISAVAPDKDVDCFHPLNVGRLMGGNPTFVPCTPAGILELLRRYDIQVTGAHVVILGRSNIVGKPLANLLLQKQAGANATVTVCHTGTVDLPAYARAADILVAAMGNPEFVRGEWLRPGSVVVDVGTNRVSDPGSPRGSRLVGDVHFPSASAVVSAITPVPGGVGPLTVAMLMVNTLAAARKALPETRGARHA
jgi:methylenetetrahydrofolate dehydrogenase (NADP+)/methenyltetrahydrofolate cyclohydrolase